MGGVACLLLALAALGTLGARRTPAPTPPPSQPPSRTPPATAVPVHIAGIRQTGPDQVLLLLADEGEQRAVPIAVGWDQGIAIYLGKMKAETARPLTHDLLATILGVVGAADVRGVLVASVAKGGSAERAGVRRGDIVQELDGRPVAGLPAYLEAAGADIKSFTIWRDGRTTTLTRNAPGG